MKYEPLVASLGPKNPQHRRCNGLGVKYRALCKSRPVRNAVFILWYVACTGEIKSLLHPKNFAQSLYSRRVTVLDVNVQLKTRREPIKQKGFEIWGPAPASKCELLPNTGGCYSPTAPPRMLGFNRKLPRCSNF